MIGYVMDFILTSWTNMATGSTGSFVPLVAEYLGLCTRFGRIPICLAVLETFSADQSLALEFTYGRNPLWNSVLLFPVLTLVSILQSNIATENEPVGNDSPITNSHVRWFKREQIAMLIEHSYWKWPLSSLIYLLEMVIFHGSVRPEGIPATDP